MKTSPAAKDPMAEATSAAARIDADVYLYNGPLVRGRDFTCVESIASHQSRERVVLLLTTHGGDPDAAYKIARFLQEKYKHITVLVSGLCKSVGSSNHEQPKDKHDKGNHGGDPARATRQTGAQAATPANGSTRGKRQQGSPSPSK